MNIKEISPRFFVSEQIQASDVGLAAARGIKTIISNRPDNESADQPETQAIAKAAADSGIDFQHIPVVSGSITEKDVRDFTAAYRSSEGPVLAYCRSGMRSTSLWALAEVEWLGVEATLSAARDAGYDIAALHERLESLVE